MYALIIAGGEGERLRPLTNDRPKNMVPVAGRTIAEHQLEWLREGGVTDVVFLCRYKAEVLQSHVGDGSKFGMRVQYSIEREPLGRGGALKLGFALVPEDEERVVAVNGDNLIAQPLPELIAFHLAKHAVATIMLAPLKTSYGIAEVAEDGHIESFSEKPTLPYWVNAGVYILEREVLSLLPDKGDHETTTFPALVAQSKLFGFKSSAYWQPIDNPKDISLAEQEIG